SEINAANSPYVLALGDSIAYGWQPDWSQFQGDLPKDPANLQKAILGQGYPEKVAKQLNLATRNGSCPGEGSGSFIDKSQKDNGCREKRADGLKMTTPWGTAATQLEFAIAQVKSPRPPDLITLDIGGNDLFLLQDDCKASAIINETLCIASATTLGLHGAPTVKSQHNVETIITALHGAGYRGTLVVVSTYAMTYTLLSGEPLVFSAFNNALRAAVAIAAPKTPG